MNTLGDKWPDCAADLTGPMRAGAAAAYEHFDVTAAVKAERRRVELNQAMAELFDQVDLVIAATNPDTAFGAEEYLPTTFGGKEAPAINNGALTIPANIYGNPGVSIPIGQASDGLPVGMQVLAGHFNEPLLLDLGLIVETERPWPLTAP